MLTYEDLVASLEEAWMTAGLHEHEVVESVQPDALDRSYRVELFPDHPEPLTAENMPPWVEVSFTWSALHQIRAERRDIPAEPLDLVWTYTVNGYGLREQTDYELVRLFQKAFMTTFRRFYRLEAAAIEAPTVEVHRIYTDSGPRLKVARLQLVSTSMTDLTEQWDEHDPRVLLNVIRTEMQFASAIIRALTDVFNPGGQGGYRAVDAA